MLIYNSYNLLFGLNGICLCIILANISISPEASFPLQYSHLVTPRNVLIDWDHPANMRITQADSENAGVWSRLPNGDVYLHPPEHSKTIRTFLGENE